MTHLFKSRPGWGLPSARYARLGQAPSGFTEGMLHYPSDRLSVQCYEIDRCCLLNYSGEESDAFSIDIDDSDRGYGDVPE